MKALERIAHVALAALIMLTLPRTDTAAQLRAGMEVSGTSVMAAPDTLSTDQERLLIDLLGTSFQSLAEKSRRGRRIGGYTLLGLGVGSGLGGTATLAFGEGDDARIVGLSLLGGGALLSGLSLLPFKLRGESERIYTAFRRMPANAPDQIRQKYVYWDRRFEELAQERRQGRIIGGISSIAVGVAAGLIVMQSSDHTGASAGLSSALGPILGGVTSLVVKSDAEQLYETYRHAKDDVLTGTATTAIHGGVAPLPNGGMHGAVPVRY